MPENKTGVSADDRISQRLRFRSGASSGNVQSGSSDGQVLGQPAADLTISDQQPEPANSEMQVTQVTTSLPVIRKKKEKKGTQQHTNSNGALTEEQTFYLTPLLRRKLRKLSDIVGVDMSEIAEFALEQFVSNLPQHTKIMRIIQIEDEDNDGDS